MSGRCKSCDNILTEQEMKYKDIEGKYLEVCFACQVETKLAEAGYYDNSFSKSFAPSDFGIKESYRE